MHPSLPELQEYLEEHALPRQDLATLFPPTDQPISSCLMKLCYRLPRFQMSDQQGRKHFLIRRHEGDEYLRARCG